MRSILGRARVTHLSVGSLNFCRIGQAPIPPAYNALGETDGFDTDVSQRACRASTKVAAIGAINDDQPVGRQTVEPLLRVFGVMMDGADDQPVVEAGMIPAANVYQRGCRRGTEACVKIVRRNCRDIVRPCAITSTNRVLRRAWTEVV